MQGQVGACRGVLTEGQGGQVGACRGNEGVWVHAVGQVGVCRQAGMHWGKWVSAGRQGVGG